MFFLFGRSFFNETCENALSLNFFLWNNTTKNKFHPCWYKQKVNKLLVATSLASLLVSRLPAFIIIHLVTGKRNERPCLITVVKQLFCLRLTKKQQKDCYTLSQALLTNLKTDDPTSSDRMNIE